MSSHAGCRRQARARSFAKDRGSRLKRAVTRKEVLAAATSELSLALPPLAAAGKRCRRLPTAARRR
ncbi:hypothetical protein CBM2623_U60017 [Cupriavidus taiwanensis]|nr:hypothetical protein CBM2623_U60017 [Cupriavidus taiwanensis]